MSLDAGAAVAVSSLGNALAIAMMVGGGGAPPLAAWLGTDWIRAPGPAPSFNRFGGTFPVVLRISCLIERCHRMRASVAHAMRQLKGRP